MMKSFEGDGADRAGVIGLIRQGFVRVGLEADQPDSDRGSSDQGLLIGRSGCDRSDQRQLRTATAPSALTTNKGRLQSRIRFPESPAGRRQ